MTKDGLFLILSILIILIFIGVVIYWLFTNSKPYELDQTNKGYYNYAQLNQRCVSDNTPLSESLLLPGYFSPQPCGYNLTCVKVSETDPYGICKSVVSGFCNNVYDCAPSFTDTIYCSGGVCTIGPTGGLYSSCGVSGPTGGSPIGIFCNGSLNLTCFNGTCLYLDGTACTTNSQCAGGYCQPNSYITPGQTGGICISPIQGGQTCYVQYCETGYYCSSEEGTKGVCQPIIGSTGTNFVPAAPGEVGAFCSIFQEGQTLEYPCNPGLICNFNPYTNSSTLTLGVTGLGLCDVPKVPLTFSCASAGGACIAPAVCYGGVTGPWTCQAPFNNGVPDINWCGNGSTNTCGSGFTCDNTIYKCRPNTGSLCNPGITGGTCSSGTCSGNYLSIFSPSRSKIGTTGTFGVWNSIPLSSITTTSNTCISVYQTMTLDEYYNPITLCKIMISDPSYSTYFYYGELEITVNNTISVSSHFKQINLISSNIIIGNIKFSSGGNIGINALNQNSIPIKNTIYYFPISALDLINNRINEADSVSNFTTSYNTIQISDFDIDDIINNGVVAYVSSYNEYIFWIFTNSGSHSETFNKYYLDTRLSNPSSVKYITNPTDTTSSSITKVITDGILISSTSPSINYLGGAIVPPDIPIKLYDLEQNKSNCVAAFYTLSNTINDSELYYVSNLQYNYVNKTTGSNPIEISLEGYPPNGAVSGANRLLAMGNLDARLYTISQICV